MNTFLADPSGVGPTEIRLNVVVRSTILRSVKMSRGQCWVE